MSELENVSVTSNGRHFSGIVTRQLMRYVQHVLGDEGVEELLACAGDVPDLRTLRNPTSWISYDEMKRLLEAAGELLGGWDGVRRAGRYLDSAEEATAFQAMGSPQEILRSITATTGKFATVLDMEPVEVTDEYGVVAARSREGFPRYDLLCAVTVGILSHGAKLFGPPPSRVVEEECELRGADRCIYRVSWATGVAEADRRVAQLELELAQARLAARNLQRTVRTLVTGADVDEVLARITSEATLAVPAPRHLLVVNPSGEPSDVRVHQIGFGPDEIEAAAAELLLDDLEPRQSRLVADVRSGERFYGRLAAVNPEGIGFLVEEESMFAAYAELAAAALDSATALEASRRQEEVTQALLDLGAALARLTSAEDAAQRLAEAVTATIGCDMASVLLLDPVARRLRVVAGHGLPREAAEIFLAIDIGVEDTPYVEQLLNDPAPIFFDRREQDPTIRAMMKMTGSVTAVGVPITNGTQTFGVVTASSGTDNLRPDPSLLRRLAGIADQGATASRTPSCWAPSATRPSMTR